MNACTPTKCINAFYCFIYKVECMCGRVSRIKVHDEKYALK